MKQVTEQTFGGGMRQDIDAHLQPNNSYRYARNGRLLYNLERTDTGSGRSMSFSNVPGNTLSLALTEGVTVIGIKEAREGTVLFLTTSVASEIGFWYFDTVENGTVVPGRYTTLYTDLNDPHLFGQPYKIRPFNATGRDRLNWSVTDSIEAEVYYETEQVERLYWTNRRGTKHVLNLRDQPKTLRPYTNYYPSYWSVHAFRERSDVVFPLLKLKGRCKGRLLSGAYQIAVQYRSRNGQRSAFSPVTRRTFVTAEGVEAYHGNGAENIERTAYLRGNHHNRVMTASGKVTNEGLRWELARVDVRWDEVVVAVLYYETEGLPAKIHQLKPIPINALPDEETHSITVDITQLSGDELTVAELNQRHECILKVGTLAAHQNRLVEGNLIRLAPFGMDGGAVKFTPILKSVQADFTREVHYVEIHNPISGRPDNDPLTNSVFQAGVEVRRKLFGEQEEIYTIEKDYANDKGQVWEWLHGSHFRGETYEWASVVFDRLGQPMFAQPLPAFTFPEQYTPGPAGEPDYYTLTQPNAADGTYDLRPMGVSISGLRLPTDSLYDSEGRINASGFMLVRRKRQVRLAHQGVVFPVAWTDFGEEGRNKKPYPLPYLNYFATDATKPNRHAYDQVGAATTISEGDVAGVYSEPYLLTYHSPDILIEGSFIKPEQGDVLKHVGLLNQAYERPLIYLNNSEVTLPGGKKVTIHSYTKSLNTRTDSPRIAELAQKGRPILGETSRISLALLHNQGFNTTYNEDGKTPFDRDDLNLKFETQTHPVFGQNNGKVQFYGDGLLQRNSVLMKAADWRVVDAGSQAKPASYRLVNYIRPASEQADDKTVENVEPFYSCGHFQPLTPQVLAKAKPIMGDDEKITHYEFNDIEVWGGDAYVSLFDFTRIYPYYSDDCRASDYSMSHIVPIESKYNLMLRSGRTFAKNAVRPEKTACENNGPQYQNGIMAQQPEDWAYNKVLLVDTSVNSYGVPPRDFKPVVEQPAGFSWTPRKQAGQLLDAWRMRLAGDAGQVDGSLGTITKLIKSDFQGLYCFQQHGFCLIPLDAMQLQASDAGTIVTQSGAVFHQAVPISHKYGTQHPDSVWSHEGQLGAWDARMGVLIRHSQAGLDVLSKSENMNDFIATLTLPLGAASEAALQNWDCKAGVDLENGEILMTFRRTGSVPFTLAYSTAQSGFVGFRDVLPARYGNRGRTLVSINPHAQNEIFTHNRGNYGQFYGAYHPTVLRFIVNPQATTNKVFQNGALNVNRSGWEKIKRITHWVPNEGEQQVHSIEPVSDERARFHQNSLQYLLHETDWDDTKERMRDHYMTVEIEIQNDDTNTPVTLTSFRTIYRLSE